MQREVQSIFNPANVAAGALLKQKKELASGRETECKNMKQRRAAASTLLSWFTPALLDQNFDIVPL